MELMFYYELIIQLMEVTRVWLLKHIKNGLDSRQKILKQENHFEKFHILKKNEKCFNQVKFT